MMSIGTSEEMEKSGFGESSHVCKPLLLGLPDLSLVLSVTAGNQRHLFRRKSNLPQTIIG